MKRSLVLLVAPATAIAMAIPAGAAEGADRAHRPTPERIEDLRLSSPRTSSGSLDGLHPSLPGSRG